MTEPIKLRRPAKFLHTGKHDYDDGFRVGSNCAKRRTIRAFKRGQRRESLKYMTQDEVA